MQGSISQKAEECARRSLIHLRTLEGRRFAPSVTCRTMAGRTFARVQLRARLPGQRIVLQGIPNIFGSGRRLLQQASHSAPVGKDETSNRCFWMLSNRNRGDSQAAWFFHLMGIGDEKGPSPA